ncbi:MAG: Crp/Fnr family transcriptional regulator [Leucobacter sp.]
MIGDLSIFDGSVQSVTTISIGPVESAVLSAESLREWLSSSPEAWTRYIRVQQFRLEQVIDAHNNMFGLDVSARVADAILREAHRFGVKTPGGLRVSLVLSHEELALHVRASRERVTQVMGSLVRMGWIRREGSDLLIVDETRLMHRAGRTLPNGAETA